MEEKVTAEDLAVDSAVTAVVDSEAAAAEVLEILVEVVETVGDAVSVTMLQHCL